MSEFDVTHENWRDGDMFVYRDGTLLRVGNADDDVCHGSGCLMMQGAPMLHRCDHCGQLTDNEYIDCACPPYYGDEEDEEWDAIWQAKRDALRREGAER